VANASTIRRQVAGTQQLTIAPLLGTTITTTPTAFQLNNNGLTLTGGGVIPLAAGVTGLYQGTGQVINVHAAGQLTGGTVSSTSLIIKLYQVPASLLPIANTLAGAQTFTNWNLLATSATGTLGSTETAGSFNLDADVQLDSQGNLDGTFQALVLNAVVGAGTPAQWKAITLTTGLTGEADLNFVIVATLGSTEAGVVLNLNEFALNLV
jgi:hypothetical protein